MERERSDSFGSKESIENQRRNSRDNTEYVPTRCRITKPTPPKPAANPMQFVKIGPCELYRKAQEQIKKVEEVKIVRPEVRDKAEDWQANLDNWKSSRRKRQEHIIERVVEVKKFEQQELEKGRRKSKTFNEILEERVKRKNKLSISVYDDDPNDFSDYGIGRSKSECGTNNNDENNDSRELDVNDNKDNESISCNPQVQPQKSNDTSRSTTNTFSANCNMIPEILKDESKNNLKSENTQEEPEQYTYESAIQSYRSRVISKNNLSSVFSKTLNNNIDDEIDKTSTNNTITEVEEIVSKGSISKRKELFENDRLLNHFETNTSQRLSEDFINSQSLKERLLSLEKFTDPSLVHLGKVSADSSDVKNSNNSKLISDQIVRNRVTSINHINVSSSDESEDRTKSKSVIYNKWPNQKYNKIEHESFVNKFEHKQIHRSLDNLTDSTSENISLEKVQSLEGLDCCHMNSPVLNSFDELLTYGDTDREDSGIHTADVSCSVSQADEPVDDVITEEEVKCTNFSLCPVLQFDGVFATEEFPLGPPVTALEPPKEKPPPPPVTGFDAFNYSGEPELKRLNSTKRIKKEIQMKRSSFLGIDPDVDDQPELEASVRNKPDINSLLQRESRLEKQIDNISQQSNYSEAGDSQDSGVELERGRLSVDTWCSTVMHKHSHNRQTTEPHTTKSFKSFEDEITKKEREIIELVEQEEQCRDSHDFPAVSSYNLPKKHHQQKISTDYEISKDDEHSEVLRVEHELLQLEREEQERQKENMIFRENKVHMQSKMYLKNKGLSLEAISNHPESSVDYRKSMPELQRDVNMASSSTGQFSDSKSPFVMPRTLIREPYGSEPYSEAFKSIHPVSNRSLQMLNTGPRFRPQTKYSLTKSRDKTDYNQHWLIQEAEQRRLSEQSNTNWKLSRLEKHLPDPIIQTLTQRVQNRLNLPDRGLLTRTVPHSPHSVGHALPINHPHFVTENSPNKLLSVSGKKKCSYCGNELGRGAAMIIESLCLFFHMECFKCCVCHVQLGDGRMGTDVRVRNNKLHCHNCYSSDDGVKFSCV